MVTNYDPETRREQVYNRWGEGIGQFVLRDGYWEFLPDQYRKEKVFTPAELQWIEARQMELNT